MQPTTQLANGPTRGRLAEVWAIRHPKGHLLPPMDCDGTGGFMAWPSRAQAERGLKHQLEMYDLDDDGPCVVERIA